MALEFLFDVDDTLIYNQYLYSKVYADFIDFMLKKTNAKLSARQHSNELLEIIKQTSPRCRGIEEIIRVHKLDPLLKTIFTVADDFNKEGVNDNKANPFYKERVPTALRKAYFKICGEPYGRIQPCEEDAKEAYEIGKGFHNVQRDIVEGAENVLQFLKEKECKMKIYTCGDAWLQQKKIDVNGFDRYFTKENQIIVPKKDDGEIRDYICSCDPNHTFMVGNSIKHDIAPAVEAGIRAIYFPSVTFYSWDDAKMKEEHKRRVITISNLEWIKDNYEFLESLK